MAIERQNLHRYAHFRIDFGLNEAQQDVQSEIPELVQYDNNSGMFVFDFFNLGRRVDTTNYTIVLNFLLPNGDLVTDLVTNKQASRAIYYTPSGILNQEGMVEGNVMLHKEGVNVTSPVRFKFFVQRGIETDAIVENDRYPILLQLMEQVEDIHNQAYEWESKLEAEYNKQVQDFNQLYYNLETGFDITLEEKVGEFDRALGASNTTFDHTMEQYNNEFQDLKNQFDTAFNSFDMGGAFEEKFQGLEAQYAKDYTDMKATVKEVYATTLTYRYVDENE